MLIMLLRQISLGSSRCWALRTKAILYPSASAGRGFAQIAPGQDSKPPVALFGLDGTYASALVSLSLSQSSAYKSFLFSK